MRCAVCSAPLDPQRIGGMCAACLIDSALDEARETEPLGEFGGHELVAVIARGGMGIVYRARQREPRREVALKTLHAGELRSPDARARFRAETRALAETQHPAILPLHQCGEQDGVPFFTMQLARGGSLAERVQEFAGQWRRIAELMVTVADAVHHAHQRGILHRDLKPANLLFDEAGRVYVSDFGLARFAGDASGDLTLPAAVLGTPHYLAPEVAANGARAATIASDVWSLGVILYELLAQSRPFEGESVVGVLRAISERNPRGVSQHRSDVPRDLDIIVEKAMAPNAAVRYSSAQELANDLRRWLDGRPIQARPVSAFERARLWTRRNPAVAALSAALGLALLIGGVALGVALQASRKSARELRENLYAADINVAHRAATDRDLGRAAALLEKWRPAHGEPDLREFAWFYLRAQAKSDPAQVLTGHKALVSAVAIGVDGTHFFSCSHDGTVRRWKLPSGEPDGLWRSGDGVLMDLDLLADGRLLVAGEQGVQLLDPKEGTWQTLDRRVAYGVRATPDGKAALAGVHQFLFQTDDVIDIVPISDAVASAEVLNDTRRLPEAGGRGVFSPDGQLLATGAWHDLIKLWNWPEARQIGELRPSGAVLAMAFSPDGKVLAAAERSGQVAIWNVNDRRLLARLTEHTPQVAWSVAFSPDGTRLVTTGSDQMVRLWETKNWTLLYTYRGHASEVWPARFTPDGERIISGSKDETIRIWNARPLAGAMPPSGIREETAPVVSGDSRLVAVALQSGQLAIFEIANWREVRRCGGSELPLALVDNGAALIGLHPGHALRRWRVTDGILEKEVLLEKADPTPVRHMLSPDARWLAGYAADHTVVIWNALNGKIAARLRGHTNSVLCAAFSPDGKWLATGSSDFTTRLWRVTSDGRFTQGPVLRGHKSKIADVAFSPDSAFVATASWDDTARIWSVADGSERHVYGGHFTGALSVIFIPGSPTVATLNGIAALKFWDLRSGRILLDLPGSLGAPTDSLVAVPDGRMIVATGKDGRLRVWAAPR